MQPRTTPGGRRSPAPSLSIATQDGWIPIPRAPPARQHPRLPPHDMPASTSPHHHTTPRTSRARRDVRVPHPRDPIYPPLFPYRPKRASVTRSPAINPQPPHTFHPPHTRPLTQSPPRPSLLCLSAPQSRAWRPHALSSPPSFSPRRFRSSFLRQVNATGSRKHQENHNAATQVAVW